MIKKITLLLLACLLMISLVGCQSKDAKEEQTAFDKFITESFVKSMEENYLSAHMSFEHPENYGIDINKSEVSLGERLDESSFEKVKKELKESQDKFKVFDRDILTAEQKDTYDIYQSQLEASERSLKEKFTYIGSLFEDGNGLHIQLTSIFEHFPLRKEKDIQDLMTLLKDTKGYIDSGLSYTKKQVEEGTFMTNIDSVNEYCQKIVDKGLKSSLLKSMKESIDLVDISSDKKSQYKQQCEQMFKDYFLVAYQDIIDTLNSLKSAKNNTQGLSHLKDGKEYYEILVQNEVGDDVSIKKMKKLLDDTGKKYYRQIITITSKNSSIYDQIDNAQTKYSDYQTMLNDLNKSISNSFPKVDRLNYEIKDIDPEVASDSIGAYFLVPALDQKTPMQIRVNNSGRKKINEPSVFTTVAHEGIPGHMYQHAYTQQHYANNPYRLYQSCNSAYSEGYAKYVEMLSYDYIDGVSEDVINLLKAQEIYSYIQIVLADIGIHYEGWDLKEFMQFLKAKGLTLDEKNAQEQYNQLQANPGIFISYFVGFAEFDSLRDKAEEELGDKFDELGFHEAILKSGVVPFSVVERNVKTYIEDTK